MPEAAATELIEHYFAISRLLAGQLDFRSAIQAVADEIRQILPHDHLDVCIIGDEGQFHSAYEAGFQTVWSKDPRAPVADSPIYALLVGQVDHILAENACEDPRFRHDDAWHSPIYEHNLRSRIHVPMMVRGEIIGAFSCSSHSIGLYSARHVGIARSVADLLSPYFYALRAAEQAKQAAVVETEARAREEGLRLGALRLTEALEAERQRIGMDLHDQTLADLTRLVRRLENIAREGVVGAAALEPVTRGLHQSMQDLRQIIEQAKPTVLLLFGFAQAIENHLERSIRVSGQPIDWRLEESGEGDFDGLEARVSIALFRIVQEAVNNAVHHSGAGFIRVILRRDKDLLQIEVLDDGKGLPRRKSRQGSGIENMTTRARLISARFQLGPGLGGQGTRVSLELPIGAGAGPLSEQEMGARNEALGG